jgi:hypothetical protein
MEKSLRLEEKLNNEEETPPRAQSPTFVHQGGNIDRFIIRR